ncbi:Uncharacterised protein [Klebsiella variicola]|uniref:hypothetical protein n=1 Tax=Klebsiella variicola TaxID=244366 RepID=UPI000DE6370D|nr:hypothetical protein [Klebsiella variicola]SSM99790.1 Uncharacterised protein [Klebsiella variicola]
MTDITELAQREKFEVWAHSQKLSLAYGDCGYAFSSTEMAWRAWMASSAELVEALEKAQGMEAYWKTQCRGITDHCEELQARIAELESRTVTVKQGEVLVTVAGFTGCGKSAIAGEIEIAMKAIGLPVTWANGDSEKRMTGADWLTAIEMYKPTVRIVEVNIPRAAGIKVEAE